MEFGSLLEELLGRSISVKVADRRPGDQRVFVSDIRRAKKELGWEPEITISEGVNNQYNWIRENPVGLRNNV